MDESQGMREAAAGKAMAGRTAAGEATASEAAAGAAAREVVRIERMSYGSAAVGRLASGKTVFVEGAAPQETVEVQVTEEKPSFARARMTRVLEPAQTREPRPACARGCGGCPWAHLAYAAQLEAKRACVVDALVRTAHMDAARAEELVGECAPSKRQWGYRNKLEFACGTDAAGRLTLGLFREGTHDLVSVDACPLAVRFIERAPKALRGALRYLQGSQDLGIFRVGVRASLRTKSTEIALWTPPSAFPRAAVAKTLKDAVKATSVVRVLAEPGCARKVKKVEVLDGRGLWEESVCDARFLTSAPSFFQVNTAQAEKLVKLVMEGLEVSPGMYVADLYAGGGTFSIPLAQAGADVVAVEVAGSSVRDLRRNADANKAFVEAVCGDTARELPELGELDALVVDPPRAGLARGVVDSIAAAGPARVAYVSCDPQTWARDVALFEQRGYRLVRATPVDLFPQTYHVETASILAREDC
ncbi:23S rRNA (uracil(1939)-C(5))-methyltransferase RlmD [Adlercreutzia sp. ZJ473]|uniref:23S rRNA (uracil(1939)-C(5))-methyltransferase RlmD n=1 Tax=Adlercreutzia sp. ZJ473 TaxID=2722822 RepID=UPI00210F9659|nr:23S rRNA (uracil(1939)-C(5))-methyltransferase RlmD [Adlercreutzia sp. ZJ473]